jgi:hypothetical protein
MREFQFFESIIEKNINDIQGNFLTTIFDLSQNDILCDLIMVHKYGVFLTVVEKSYFLLVLEEFDVRKKRRYLL